ncbi:MAG: type II secretion system minor pseudopilin GspK [Pseudomonadota bacterium]|nr:type II secretion system minor pseudopilin GspK [Pseudomonadota bacterium]MDP2352718.1 type II secretion system minor pseudopilin GspK [Pseudomonadota bacterium]
MVRFRAASGPSYGRGGEVSPAGRDKGIALITVILIVALATTVASFVAWRQQVWTRQVENLRDASQGEAVVRAGVDWAGAILSEDRRKNAVDHLGEPWMQHVALPVERGRVAGGISDLQARFNLNNLVRNGQASGADIAVMRRLLETLDLPLTLVDALVDWLDADGLPYGADGAEDAYYLAKPTPYYPANRALVDLSELLLVRGYEPEVLDKLAPYVCVLPIPTPVNVNTASAEVLSIVIPGLTVDDARRLVEERGDGSETVAGFRGKLSPAQVLGLQESLLSVASDFFLVDLSVEFGRVRQRYLALYQRQGQNWPLLLWLKQL